MVIRVGVFGLEMRLSNAHPVVSMIKSRTHARTFLQAIVFFLNVLRRESNSGQSQKTQLSSTPPSPFFLVSVSYACCFDPHILQYCYSVCSARDIAISESFAASSSTAGYIRPHMRRFSWMMISFTAAMTNLICMVSVAHVKWV